MDVEEKTNFHFYLKYYKIDLMEREKILSQFLIGATNTDGRYHAQQYSA